MTTPQIKHVRGSTFKRTLITPWNLTGCVLKSELRDSNTKIADFTLTLSGTSSLPNSRIMMYLSDEQTELIPEGRYFTDVRIEQPSGEVIYTPTFEILILRKITQSA